LAHSSKKEIPMSHVTFMRFRALPGHRDAILDLMRSWERDHLPRVRGFERTIVAESKDSRDEVLGATFWDSTEHYMANANSPEQDRWYQQLRAHLAEDPTWYDCTLLYDTGKAGVNR